MKNRIKTQGYNKPLNVYELHLGSWRRYSDGNTFNYADIALELAEYVKEMGYTHIEVMPLSEYPYDPSWGYQVTGYFSVTSRYGTPKDFMKFVDIMHQNGIGVIMDWVPGHFTKDAHGLIEFDGKCLYEPSNKYRKENPSWGTRNFDYGRTEIQSFLVSSAIFWCDVFHIDGLRTDAVSSMLYLDYCREEGQWQKNSLGTNINLEAVAFIKKFNDALKQFDPSILSIAEESTTYPLITAPTCDGGLGFDYKWNMGWMNDTLEYVEMDPIYRKYHHSKLTFSMMYNYSENFILPISHDEVVHGKKSLVDKMWGDYWNKFAGLRLYLAYMMGHPGKKLTFMGYEFAQFIEWREYEELEWKLIDGFDMHKNTQIFSRELNNFYKENKALWELDYDTFGFEWIDADNSDQSIYTFIRRSSDTNDILVFVCNFTPVVYHDFRLGVPYDAEYEEVFNTDSVEFGGSNQLNESIIVSDTIGYHYRPYSISIKVPPMATSIFRISKMKDEEVKEE